MPTVFSVSLFVSIMDEPTEPQEGKGYALLFWHYETTFILRRFNSLSFGSKEFVSETFVRCETLDEGCRCKLTWHQQRLLRQLFIVSEHFRFEVKSFGQKNATFVKERTESLFV